MQSWLTLHARGGLFELGRLQFQRGGVMFGLQIDFIFISPELHKHLVSSEVQVYRYHSDLRVPLPMPRSLDQRLTLPSDHYPVVATFRNFLPE